MGRKVERRVAALTLLALLLGAGASGAKTQLSEKHKKWLEEEVVYIISDDEKKVFRNLPSDAERDQFIEQFWELRDPTPGTPANEYKEEHYRRIEHANLYFGIEAGTDGWRTDRGRIYIQLGPPAQRIQHRWLGEIRPLELWFYSQNEHPSLPTSFNVMFFRPDSSSALRLYSPYLDGPDKLVKRTGAENNPEGSYRFLRDFNPEIARASVTLLTDEPIDPEGFTPSLASDSMLTRIRNLPNDKFTKEMLERRRQLRETVQTRIIYDPSTLEILAVPLRDATGEHYVHFLLMLPSPLKNLVVKAKDQHILDATVSVLVQTSAKKKVYQQSHTQRFAYGDDYAWKQGLPVGYEDRLPLTPGEYELDFVFRNERTQTLYQSHQQVQVPAPPQGGVRLSPLVVYGSVNRIPDRGRGGLPFEFSDMKFIPELRRKFASREELSVFFQITDLSAGPNAGVGEKLRIEYTLGRPAGGGLRQTFTEEISKKEFTPYGTVFHGKSFSLKEFPTGSYRLVVRVTDPATSRGVGETLSFQVVPGSVESKRVVLINGRFADDLQSGQIDYRWGQCEVAAQRLKQAVRYLHNALSRNPALHEARNQLTEIYFEQKQFEQVASLYPADGLSRKINLASVRRFVESFEQTGQVDKAIEVAEQALEVWGPQLPLYEQLALLYDRTGQPGRAEQMRDQARSAAGPRSN